MAKCVVCGLKLHRQERRVHEVCEKTWKRMKREAETVAIHAAVDGNDEKLERRLRILIRAWYRKGFVDGERQAEVSSS